MGILEKFGAVEISADRRLSPEDRDFCERNQKAYDKAGAFMRPLLEELRAVEAEQTSLLPERKPTSYHPYLSESRLDTDKIKDSVIHRHKTLIIELANYFQRKYHVVLNNDLIYQHLVPQKEKEPEDRDFSNMDSYLERARAKQEREDAFEAKLVDFHLDYTAIIDEIFTQLGGFSFDELSLRQLKGKLWTEQHFKPWNKDTYEERFRLKKGVVEFMAGKAYLVRWEDAYSYQYWYVQDHLNTVLEALAHLETGTTGKAPELFRTLYGQYNIVDAVHEYPGLKKIKSIKLYKNNRVDIRFTDYTSAQEFVNTYLNCPPESREECA